VPVSTSRALFARSGELLTIRESPIVLAMVPYFRCLGAYLLETGVIDHMEQVTPFSTGGAVKSHSDIL